MPVVVAELPVPPTNWPLLLEGTRPFLDLEGKPLRLLHDQIVVWASLLQPDLADMPPDTPRFPLVLDTGFNDTLLISESQLRVWAALPLQDLPLSQDKIRVGRIVLPKVELDLWLHGNRPGSHELSSTIPSRRLSLPGGIAVWPDTVPGAKRLPLLGMLGVHLARLQIQIDGPERRISINFPDE